MNVHNSLAALHSAAVHNEKKVKELTEELDLWKSEIQPEWTDLREPAEISQMLDDMYENIKELKAEVATLETKNKKRTKCPSDLVKELKELKEEHRMFRAGVAEECGLNEDFEPSDVGQLLEEKQDDLDEMGETIEGYEHIRKTNTDLTKFAMDVHNLLFGTKFDDPDIVQSFDFEAIKKKIVSGEENLKD